MVYVPSFAMVKSKTAFLTASIPIFIPDSICLDCSGVIFANCFDICFLMAAKSTSTFPFHLPETSAAKAFTAIREPRTTPAILFIFIFPQDCHFYLTGRKIKALQDFTL